MSSPADVARKTMSDAQTQLAQTQSDIDLWLNPSDEAAFEWERRERWHATRDHVLAALIIRYGLEEHDMKQLRGWAGCAADEEHGALVKP